MTVEQQPHVPFQQPAGRMPPHDPVAEAGVIGGILLRPSVVDLVAGDLRPGEFYRKNNGTIYEAELALAAAGEPIDLITLATELERRGQLERVGGRAHLGLLLESVPTAANVEHYAGIVKEKARKRALIGAGAEAMKLGYDDGLTADEAVEAASALMLGVAIDAPLRSEPVSVVGEEFRAQLEARMAGGGGPTGTASGLVDLDRLTGGWGPGNLAILAGRASMGKTALAVQCALSAAVDQGLAVAIFSLEMSKTDLVERMVANRAMVDSQRLHLGTLSDAEHERVVRALGPITAAKLEIDDRAALDEWALAAEARRLAAHYGGLGLVVVDYLQLMTARRRDENRVLELGTITRGLKALSKQLRCPVLALSQLSRAPESRPDKRPQLSDLRDSGALEQDADVVVLCFRDDYYTREKSERPGTADLIVAKNRSGPVGEVKTLFRKEYTRFETLEQRRSRP